MRTSLLSLLFLVFFIPTQAQIGLSGYYDDYSLTSPDRSSIFDWESAEPGSGYTVALDYWFRLKTVRIEFLPTLAYSHFENAPMQEDLTYETWAGHFFLNTNFYLFNFLGDCDCPTFSKSDPIFKKGFFLQLSPGVSRFSSQVSSEQLLSVAGVNSNLLFSIGLGAGLDVGVTDFITVTPMARLRYYPNSEWVQSTGGEEPAPLVINNSFLQYQFGLRVGVRFDYRKY